METRQPSDRFGDGSLPSAISIGGGLAGGLLAYALGYGVIALAKSDAIESATGLFGLLSQFGGQVDYPAGWKLAAWVFYRAHNVDVLIDVPGSDSPNLLALTESVFWEPWFFVVPVVVLVLVGAGLAYATASRTPLGGGLAGGSIAFGYALAAVTGAVVTRWSASADGLLSFEAAAGPALPTAVVIAGVVYPLVLGSVGGAIGSVIRDRAR